MQNKQRLNIRQLLVFLSIGFLSLVFWHTPFLYPVKIFVVFIHEASHALTTILTGGQVISMVVTPWQSGYVQHAGGNSLFIAAAGYIGSALFGGLLLLLSTRDEWASAVFFGLAIFFGLITIFFVRNGFGLAFGLGTAVAFAFLSRRPFPGTHYIVDILAVTSALYAVYDLTDFLFIGARTDAVILAEITAVPAFVWAGLWSVISLGIVWVAGKRAVRQTSG
jgi:hypothetical protein